MCGKSPFWLWLTCTKPHPRWPFRHSRGDREHRAACATRPSQRGDIAQVRGPRYNVGIVPGAPFTIAVSHGPTGPTCPAGILPYRDFTHDNIQYNTPAYTHTTTSTIAPGLCACHIGLNSACYYMPLFSLVCLVLVAHPCCCCQNKARG